MMEIKKVLILAKTYPTPSKKHIETSCIAGIDDKGEMIRLFPVPFRLLDGSKQFKKWEWINIRTKKAKNDRRKESHTVLISEDSPQSLTIIDSKHWGERAKNLSKVPTYTSFEELEKARQEKGITLAILKPLQINQLIIEPELEPQWSKEELNKLQQDMRQLNFTFEHSSKTVHKLKKLPYHFYYEYSYIYGDEERTKKSKITDWEAGALYWNCAKFPDWEQRFRNKFEKEMIQKNAYFLMGTIHRFPDKWLIISVIYPPQSMQVQEKEVQGSLF
jgi:hypothetical protein